MNKIIYTRCSPWIDLNRDGQISRSEGFGVAATSKDFISAIGGCNKRLLLKFLEERKCDANYYEKLYEYASIGNDTYILNAVAELPLCTENRPNGSSHRPIFMAEAIVGKFVQKPGLYLSKENFKGDRVSQNDYYRLDSGMDALPFVLDNVAENDLVKEELDSSFLTPERKTVLEILLSFVIEQTKLPLNAQRPIFIKDSNENMINYIRAMSKMLPTSICKKVTFLTHTTSFKNNPERYAFYVEKAGNITEYNTFAPELKADRRVKYMIIGYTNGNIVHNQNSEFEVIDGINSSYKPFIASFIKDIVNNEESAIKFLAHLEKDENGSFPSDVDDKYKMFRDIYYFNHDAAYFDVVNFVENFTSSRYYSDPACVSLVVNNIKEYYALNQSIDALNRFNLMDKIKKLDINLAKSLLINMYQKLSLGFNETNISEDTIKLYEQLVQKGYMTENVKGEKILPYVTGDKLVNMVSRDLSESLIKVYLNLYLEVLKSSNANVSVNNNHGMVFIRLLNKYILSGGEILETVNRFLKSFDSSVIYEQLIIDASNEENKEKVDKFITLYKPSITPLERKVLEIKFNKNASFKLYEEEYINKVEFNLSKLAEYTEVLIELFNIYPYEKNNPTAGLLFASKVIDLIKVESVHNYFVQFTDYLDKLLKLKNLNDGRIVKQIITKLDEKTFAYGLRNETGIPNLEKLSSIGAKTLEQVLSTANKLSATSDPQKQAVILSALVEQNIKIPSKYLTTELITKMINSLVFDNYPIHLHFIKVFANEEEVEKFIACYLNIVLNKPKLDKIALYYSLCLIRTDQTLTDFGLKISEEITKILTKDETILSKCYEKNFEKQIKKYDAKDLNKEAALKLLTEEYNKYADNHKGFFAKLFGKKKD